MNRNNQANPLSLEEIESKVLEELEKELGIEQDESGDDGDVIVEKTINIESLEECEEFLDEEIFSSKDYFVPKGETLTQRDKDILANDNMLLLQYVVQRFQNTGIERSELESVALMGYTKAINNFNPKKLTKLGKPIKFSTFAYKCIQNEIYYFIRTERKIRDRTTPLSGPLCIDKNGNALELDSTLSTEQNGEMSLEDCVESKEMVKILNKVIDEYLDEKEQLIIRHRYGVGVHPMTQNELAAKIGMSQANISKLEKNILNKIRRLMASKFKIKEL